MYPCPACGFLVFTEPPGSYEICCVCGWEDDPVQLQSPNCPGGANHLSLYEYQQSEVLPEFSLSVTEVDGTGRCQDWRPLSPEDKDKYPRGIYYWRHK